MSPRWRTACGSSSQVRFAAMPVVVVTDSTASLPPEVAAEHGIVVVPLQVVIGADVFDEGSQGATPELVAAALKEFRPVSTSRPDASGAARGLPAGRPRRRDRDRVGPPVRGHERHLRVGAAGGAGRARAGRRGGQPAGRGRDRVRRAVGRRGRRGRRHRPRRRPRPRWPAPRRRPRSSTSTPWSTCAAAAGSARRRRCSAARWRSSRCSRSPTARWPAWSGCAPRAGRWPGWRSWPSRPRERGRSTCAWRTSRPRTGPGSSPRT